MSRFRLPRPRAIESCHPAWLGTIALVVLGAIIATVLFINSAGIGQRDVTADFAQAAQLESGNQVTVAGVPVGEVSSVKLAGDHVTVTMSLDPDVHLGQDTTAAIKLTTLLGNRYLELDPAGTGSLPDNRISLSKTRVPYNLQTALEDATTTFDQVDADNLADALNRTSNQLDGVPELVPAALRNVATLSDVIAKRRTEIGALLDSTERLTTVVRQQQANLGSLVNQGTTLLQEIQTRRQSIERLLAATTTIVDQLKPIAVDDQPEIRSLLDNLNQIMQMVAKNDALFRNIMQVLPVPWRSLANALGSGPELDANVPQSGFVDSFMCALVRAAPQLKIAPYSQECA